VRRREFLTREAYNISAYLVFQAKRYVDGCGGNTDAVIMEKNGHATNIHLRSGGRGGIEPQFQLMEHTLGELASAFFDSRTSDDEVKRSLDLLASTITDNRPLFKVR
jgi:hypothetical protein